MFSLAGPSLAQESIIKGQETSPLTCWLADDDVHKGTNNPTRKGEKVETRDPVCWFLEGVPIKYFITRFNEASPGGKWYYKTGK